MLSHAELTGLDHDDALELASLLEASSRPSNRAMLNSLSNNLLPCTSVLHVDNDTRQPCNNDELANRVSTNTNETDGDNDATLDALEVRRLLEHCSRPRSHAILQLVGAQLAAEAVRVRTYDSQHCSGALASSPEAEKACQASHSLSPSDSTEAIKEIEVASREEQGCIPRVGKISFPTLESSILLVSELTQARPSHQPRA